MTREEAIDFLKSEKEATMKLASTCNSDKIDYFKKHEEAYDIAIKELSNIVTTSEMIKTLEFLCKIAKEKDIQIEFSGNLCDGEIPTFKIKQYRTSPKTNKLYVVCRIIDIDDLTIKNIEFKEFINILTEYFDEKFNEMFEEEEE